MALRNIVTQGDPILNKKCRPVTEFDEKLANLLDDMFETMHNANGVGLAGPQVGILRRVVVIDAEDEDIELVNPRSCPSAMRRKPGWRVVSAYLASGAS